MECGGCLDVQPMAGVELCDLEEEDAALGWNKHHGCS